MKAALAHLLRSVFMHALYLIEAAGIPVWQPVENLKVVPARRMDGVLDTHQ
jgi:hypothetical protein